MADPDDAYLWLEDLESPEALSWVGERNAETLAGLPIGDTRDALQEVLDSKGRIPYPGWRGDGFYYDFWRDADHPRGLWRRTTPEQFRRDDPEWDVLLDVDELNRAEGENWTWAGVEVLRPGYDRCLIELSRGGADATVVREFDLVRRVFVDDGFVVPEAKTYVGWIDADHIFVGTDFGPGSLTSSGYPRVAKRWRRGTPLAAAELVFEGHADDVSVLVSHDPTPGFERDFAGRFIDFYHSEQFLRTPAGDLVRIEIPDDARADVHRNWLLVRLRSPWLGFPAGTLLATGFDRFLDGEREFTVLFRPDERTFLRSYSWTRNHLLLVTMTDVRTQVHVLTPGAPDWRREPIGDTAGFDQTWIVDTDPENNDSYLLSSEGFLRPATLSLEAEVLKQEPSFFTAEGMDVRQFFAVSADGTRVPYFVVGGAAGGPALLDGYGGFEVPLLPSYNGILGRGWLARGGTYVVANIRGGGEYGPEWHRAALRQNRVRAFEDFAAVAADLVTRRVTTPSQLGAMGGSNGGLLMGVMLTRYPELFGAVVARVPILDMRRYSKLLAGRSWTAEYGDPDVPADWAYLREFSPYHNIRPDRRYPPAFFLTSTRDDRVHPAHARKMTARLREEGHEVLYYENVEGGHGGAADNEQAATMWSLILEFLWQKLSMGNPPTGN